MGLYEVSILVGSSYVEQPTSRNVLQLFLTPGYIPCNCFCFHVHLEYLLVKLSASKKAAVPTTLVMGFDSKLSDYLIRAVWLEQCCKRELASLVRSGSTAPVELTLESSCIEYLEFSSCVFELRAKSCIILEPAKFFSS